MLCRIALIHAALVYVPSSPLRPSLSPSLSLSLTHTSFVNADEGGDALRALAAYCYMHRLFLQFVKESSSLVASARQTVKEFIQDEAKRHMEVGYIYPLPFSLSLSFPLL